MLNRKFVITFIISVGISVSPVMTHAQANSELPQVIIKLSIADFFSPFQPSVNVGVEHFLKGRLSWHHQANYLFRNPFETDYPDQTGFRLRSGLRLYKKKSIDSNEKVYWELNIGYLQSKMLLEDDFFRFGRTFRQRIDYFRRQEIYIATIEWGVASYQSSRWIAEVGVGCGFQFGNVHFSKVPPDATLIERGFTFFTYEENPRVSSINFGIRLKVGYVLK